MDFTSTVSKLLQKLLFWDHKCITYGADTNLLNCRVKSMPSSWVWMLNKQLSQTTFGQRQVCAGRFVLSESMHKPRRAEVSADAIEHHVFRVMHQTAVWRHTPDLWWWAYSDLRCHRCLSGGLMWVLLAPLPECPNVRLVWMTSCMLDMKKAGKKSTRTFVCAWAFIHFASAHDYFCVWLIKTFHSVNIVMHWGNTALQTQRNHKQKHGLWWICCLLVWGVLGAESQDRPGHEPADKRCVWWESHAVHHEQSHSWFIIRWDDTDVLVVLVFCRGQKWSIKRGPSGEDGLWMDYVTFRGVAQKTNSASKQRHDGPSWCLTVDVTQPGATALQTRGSHGTQSFVLKPKKAVNVPPRTEPDASINWNLEPRSEKCQTWTSRHKLNITPDRY